jgi:hypothetical protein
MEFRNLTPFHAMAWDAVSRTDADFHVVALRVAYSLEPLTGQSDATLTHTCQLIEGAHTPELCVADEYFGEAHASSVRAESDLAPFKPKCDVIVNATAYAPSGVAAKSWPVSVRVSAHRAAGLEPVINKELVVFGPRWLERRADGWHLTEALDTYAVPMRWELAFGGTSLLKDDASEEPTLHEACYLNPLGRGWLEARHFEALREPAPYRLPAPQIEAASTPITTLAVTSHPPGVPDARKMSEIAQDYPYRPAGLGFVGRAWTPRLQRAGTYDQAWVDERWPKLPRDFDPGYWNGAPDDQQIDFPQEALIFEALSLTREGRIAFQIPRHRALVLMRFVEGAVVALPMRIDTVIVDLDALRVDIVWRKIFPVEPEIRVAEARFEINPDAPLIRYGPLEPALRDP